MVILVIIRRYEGLKKTYESWESSCKIMLLGILSNKLDILVEVVDFSETFMDFNQTLGTLKKLRIFGDIGEDN